jgi:hypothetical protein
MLQTASQTIEALESVYLYILRDIDQEANCGQDVLKWDTKLRLLHDNNGL